MIAPLFPLPGVFLFPGQVLPLQIFEPRYLQMIEDLLDGAGRIVMGTVRAGQENAKRPREVLPTAGIGEIARHDRLPDGRYTILLFGLGRVEIEEIPSDRMYRLARCRALEESPVSEAEEHDLHDRLVAAIQSRTGLDIADPGGVSAGQLADLLAQTLEVPQTMMEDIFSECAVGARAAMVLDAHERFPKR